MIERQVLGQVEISRYDANMFTLCYQIGRKPTNDDVCLILNDKDEILLKQNGSGTFEIPTVRLVNQQPFITGLIIDLVQKLGVSGEVLFVGNWGDQAVWLMGLPTGPQHEGTLVVPGFVWKNLRGYLADAESSDLQQCSFRALHLRHWLLKFRYCPSCGTVLVRSDREMALHCVTCNSSWYPTISPAMIVAITRNNGRELLLAQPANRLHQWYSLIAGYCEAGESLEETIRREVREETGLQVRNLRYVSSQGWPFSQSLMLGFTAEYEAGVLQVDTAELETADWFPVNDLPLTPPPPTIANTLIEWVKKSQQ